MEQRPIITWAFVLLFLACCRGTQSATVGDGLRVALIGDFGSGDANELAVSKLVKGWETESPLTSVIALGDNAYSFGLAAEIAAKIPPYYGQFISNNPSTNRFWPCPGNHDWGNVCSRPLGLTPYTDFFQVLASKPNPRIYEQLIGGILHFFMMSSDCSEPLGNTANSQQAAWLQTQLAASTAPFKIVVLHHPPFSSSRGYNPTLDWPFAEWGADMVISGHDHVYERLNNPRKVPGKDGFPHFVNGAGGQALYTFANPQASSSFRYNSDFGAQLIKTVVRPFATGAYYDLDISFYSAGSGTTGGTLQDCYRVTRLVSAGAATTTSYAPGCPALTATSDYSLFTNELAPAFAPSPLQKWKYFDAGKKSLSVKTWPTLPYDDSAWAVGASPLGYGAGNVTWGTTLASNAGFTGKGRAFYYFRTVLCIASDTISQLTAVKLKVAASRGARVYINGVLQQDFLAADGSFSYWTNTTDLKPGTLVAGQNIIAVQVSNTQGSSSAGFDLDLIYSATAPFAANKVGCKTYSLFSHLEAVPPAAKRASKPTWKYFGGGKASPKGPWTKDTFDDSTWSQGQPPLGFGAAVGFNYTTAIADNSAAATKGRLSYYFRYKLCLSADVLAKIGTPLLNVLSNDGAKVFINKATVSNDISGDHVAKYWNTNKLLTKKKLLVAGTNTIAVQVVNKAGSTDSGFDLDLTYLSNAPVAATPSTCA